MYTPSLANGDIPPNSTAYIEELVRGDPLTDTKPPFEDLVELLEREEARLVEREARARLVEREQERPEDTDSGDTPESGLMRESPPIRLPDSPGELDAETVDMLLRLAQLGASDDPVVTLAAIGKCLPAAEDVEPHPSVGIPATALTEVLLSVYGDETKASSEARRIMNALEAYDEFVREHGLDEAGPLIIQGGNEQRFINPEALAIARAHGGLTSIPGIREARAEVLQNLLKAVLPECENAAS